MEFRDKIIQGDCLQGLKNLPDNSIDCCVTSPPYFGLRDYGNENQIGLEETPEDFVNKLVEVFAEVKRVLKPQGTLWLNLGDSYNGYKGNAFSETSGSEYAGHRNQPTRKSGYGLECKDIKPKDLIGIPWMVAFALRANGWYLRQDIIWHKPNPMPESVNDRCTKSHEYIFLLSKSQRYFYDADAIKYPVLEESISRVKTGWAGNEKRGYTNGKQNNLSKRYGSQKAIEMTMANKRSVWSVNTKSYTEAHFATFPQELIVDCIKAGCPKGGIVLDPFMGAGTTGLVAKKLERNYVGFELNTDYIKIAEKRIFTEIGFFL